MSDRGRSGEPLRNLGVRLGFSDSAMLASSVIIGCAVDPQPGPAELPASMRGAPAPTEGSPEQHVDARRMQRWAALPASPVQGRRRPESGPSTRALHPPPGSCRPSTGAEPQQPKFSSQLHQSLPPSRPRAGAGHALSSQTRPSQIPKSTLF